MINPIIEQKKSDNGELFVNLFEWCNLNCDFCWQDHNSWNGIETIVERSVDIIHAIKSAKEPHFVVNLMGGELFADKIPDSIIKDYHKLVSEVVSNLPISKSIEINWVTNLVFHKLERLQELVIKTRNLGVQSRITTSFDFTGRFKEASRNLFLKNLKTLKSEASTISVVLTKPNIEKMLLNDDIIFKNLYSSGFNFYFDYYSPEKNFELMLPDDVLLQKGLLFLLENYPKVNPINSWINNDKNHMSCQSSIVIDHDGIKGKCRSLVPLNIKDKLKSLSDDHINNEMEDRFSKKYDCITCEFYNKCGMGCFLQHDFQNFENLDECLYKEVFRSIK
jgi:radical SAM protein with 4Fe4S-binding SPASM domain